ncbi:hypothetical protein LCGC14_2206740, partial [marine sediment metagenome]
YFTKSTSSAGNPGEIFIRTEPTSNNIGIAYCGNGAGCGVDPIFAEVTVPEFFANESFKLLTFVINTTVAQTVAYLYYNNREILTQTVTVDPGKNSQSITLMDDGDDGSPAFGHMYFGMFINRSLTTEQIDYVLDRAELGDYNLSDALPPPLDPAVKTFKITANDTYDGISLNNITINISNGSFSFLTSTINGTININNRTIESFDSLYRIDFRVNDSGGYFNNTFFDVNLTDLGSFKGSLFQSVLFLQVLDGLNNDTIQSFTAITNRSDQLTTNGEMLILGKSGFFALNITSNGFDPLFSNFSRIALENSTLNVTMGSLFRFTLIREETNTAFLVNGTNETQLTVFCSDQTIQLIFNQSSNESQIINCQFDLMQMTVDYGDLGTYFRTLIPPFTQKNITWYLIDLKEGDIAIQRIIHLLDLTREFTNAKLTVKRAVGGVIRTIIDQRFDISNNVNLFLVQNGLYTLSIDNNVSNIILGNLIPTEAGTQTITLPKIDFVPSETILGGNVSWSYTSNFSSNIIRLSYEDKTNGTTLVRFTVRNITEEIVFQGESNNNASVIMTFNQAIGNRTYSTVLFVEQIDFGNFTDKKTFYEFVGGSQGALDLVGWTVTEQQAIKKWFAFI